MTDFKSAFNQLSESQQTIISAGAQLEATNMLIKKELEEVKKQTLHFMHHLDEVFGALTVNRDTIRNAVKKL